jgi:hypothetical protein
MLPPDALPILKGFTGTCGFEQSVAQPRCIASLKIEGLSEYPGLMPTSRMQGIQTVVLDLTHIEDCLIAVWQTFRHRGRLVSHPVERKPISNSAPEKGGGYLDVRARFRPSDHSVTAKP